MVIEENHVRTTKKNKRKSQQPIQTSSFIFDGNKNFLAAHNKNNKKEK